MAAVRLAPFLTETYDREFLDKICMIKIDTEGHDVVILEDLKRFKMRPPIIWTEWFHWYQYVDEQERVLENKNFCTKKSANLFTTILDLGNNFILLITKHLLTAYTGYEIFEPSLPLKKLAGCQNEHYKSDLLLIERNFYQNSLRNIGFHSPKKKRKYEMPLP